MSLLLKVDNRPTTRRIAENNRNWSLLVAQLAFLILTGLHEAVSESVCQLFGAIIHFAYLTFFSWTSKMRFYLILFLKGHFSHGGILFLPRPDHSV